jgi:phytanoyl-CoA hydroxylase
VANKEKQPKYIVPNTLITALITRLFHQKSSEIAKELMGHNIELSFDMLINKNTITPWHQDAAYCVNMPYKCSVNCWLAFDAPC